MKDIQHILSEAVSLLPVEAQQQTREAVREGRITPQLLAALAMQFGSAQFETKTKSGDAPLVGKVDALIATVRALEQRLKESRESRESSGESKNGKVLADRVEALRRDMRGIEDGLAALEPYQHWKVLVLMGIAVSVGGLIGWYGHSNYTSEESCRHHYTEVHRE